jgi:sporulation protein YlmC with PRC-barrel domain
VIKLLSKIIEANILLRQEHAQLGPVTGYLISPDNGDFLGVFCFDPVEGADKFIPFAEINGFGDSILMARGYDSLIFAGEIARNTEALRVAPRIIGQKVKTKSGKRIGRVTDATINLKTGKLDKIFVSAFPLLALVTTDRIIPAKKIVEITKKIIFIADDAERVKSGNLAKIPLVAE